MTFSSAASGFDPRSLLNTSINEGSIHLTSLLGMGAYGVVFLGIRTNTSRRCAVKLLSESDAAKNEIKLHKRVSGHPGILPLEEIIREKGHVFLVLEYAPEGDLFSAITQKQGIVGNDRAIRSIFLQILDAVQHCHDHGVAHRDLKPENILMFPHRSVKIADFGLATGQSVSSEFGCGSSFYFSPECQGQALGHSRVVKGYSTRQNDVWSLGVILVNLVVGRNPWHQATLKDTAFAIYCRKPNQAFFKHILPSISDALADLLVRIFTLDPGRRISLPELRVRVTVMESFVASDSLLAKDNNNTTCMTVADGTFRETLEFSSSPPSTSALPWTRSLFNAVCEYASGFVEEETGVEDEQLTGLPSACPAALQGRSATQLPSAMYASPPPCISVSLCSSISSLDIPTTPHRYLSTATADASNCRRYHQKTDVSTSAEEDLESNQSWPISVHLEK